MVYALNSLWSLSNCKNQVRSDKVTSTNENKIIKANNTAFYWR